MDPSTSRSATVYSIPAHVPFLDALAGELLRRDADELADHLILLPSRRACLALRETMLRLSGGRPMLLPRLQPIGELEADELLLSPEIELGLPPALPPLRRHLLLTRLVLAKDGQMKHEQAIRLAAELMGFLDEVATEGTALEGLDALVPGDYAEHWQATLEFLKLLTQVWPKVVDEEHSLDPAERRNRLLEAWAATWAESPPATPILAAGITGSIPMVAELMRVIACLPRGAVVLPGLDRDSDAASWDAVAPSHPQHSLKRLLERIGIEREAVCVWPYEEATGGSPDRARLLAEVMRPAQTSEAWRTLAHPSAKALAGLEIITAPDLASEALQLALRIREALETPGRRVTLVTSDRNLARRVSVELNRWEVRADDSAGVPLDQSPPGSFLLLTAHAVVGGATPLPLLSMLKHPLARGGMGPGEFRRRVRAFERAMLRGPRRGGGLAGMIASLRAWGEKRWSAPIASAELAEWLDGLAQAALPLQRLIEQEKAPLTDLLDAHIRFTEWLSSEAEAGANELWAKEAGALARRFMTDLREAADLLGEVPSTAYPALLAVLMARETVRPRAPTHPRVSILGQLENRLQQADLVLVGGLNEGVWPRFVETGPWLNRAMRKAFGLPPIEQQIGIAAHDLIMAACAPQVVFSRGRKDAGGGPTKPSRWLVRLEAVLELAGAGKAAKPDHRWRDWALQLDQPEGRPEPIKRPQPRPPHAARPSEFWATDIEDLMRDPYKVYARRILKLRAIDPLDADPGLPERGQLIHAVLQAFVTRHGDEPLDGAFEKLLHLGREHFTRHAEAPQVQALWWPRFEGIARWFVSAEHERRQRIASLRAELEGSLPIVGPNRTFTIRARADRVEMHKDGGVAIIDYKTGVAPSASEVQAGLRPQLLVEGLIAAEGGFDGFAAAEPTEILYWELKGGEQGGAERNAAGKAIIGDLLAQAREGLPALLAHFDRTDAAYTAVPRPDIAGYSDYDHLARVAEWRDAGDEP